MRYASVTLVLCVLLGLLGCDSGGSSSEMTEPESPTDPLRDLASQQSVRVGAAARAGPLLDGGQYASVLAREFNALTPENTMKWTPLRPSADSFDFSVADQVVAFAEENDMDVRGHTLVWHRQLPNWLTSHDWSRDSLMTILETHVKTVVNHYEETYPNRIARWDVVNEAISGTSRRPSIWQETIGPEYVALAFQWAHEADSDAKLYYNDYGIAGTSDKSDAVYDLVRGLVEEGVPIDGVGLQAHVLTYPPPPTEEAIVRNMQRYEDLGLDVAITELDVRVPLNTDGEDGRPSSEQLDQQADYYARFANACVGAPNCSDFRMWGFTDAVSWIPNAYDGYGAALIFDETYEPKPAYDALARALGESSGDGN